MYLCACNSPFGYTIVAIVLLVEGFQYWTLC